MKGLKWVSTSDKLGLSEERRYKKEIELSKVET
jgi:hypothetical protein